jgi:ABC-type sulfate transport system permease component
VEFFITWALILGLLVFPALVNYFVNRYYSPPGTSAAPTIELFAASLTMSFAILAAAVVIVVGVALGWDELKKEQQAFMDLGLVGYGQDRPIALPGFLAAVSIGHMALLALLGAFRIPGRFVR